MSCWMAGAPTAHGQPSSLPTRRCLASRAGEACGARVCPHPASFCFSPVGEYCQQPACWQGNEPPTLAALQPSPQGLAQAPSQSLGPLTHSCPMCRTQDSTWPAETRRRSSKSIPASDTWQLQGGGRCHASAAANILPPELALPRMPLAPGVMSQSGWLPRGWAWWPLRGGGATGGVPSRREAGAGIAQPPQSPAECSLCAMRVGRPRGRQQRLAPGSAC